MIRLQSKSEGSPAEEVTIIQEVLKTTFGEHIEFRKIDYVGPKVGKELVQSGMQALLAAIIGILLYVLV